MLDDCARPEMYMDITTLSVCEFHGFYMQKETEDEKRVAAGKAIYDCFRQRIDEGTVT